MKNIGLSALALSLAIISYGQVDSYSENFDSFNTGDYMGVVGISDGWTTWSGTTGGAEDVQVANDQAYSDSNSIYFYSNSTTGGPQDVVLAFDDAYVEGIFQYEMMMYVTAGTDAYFNFQAESTPGVTWAMEFYCENGALSMSNTQGALLAGSMSTGQWVRIGYHINLTENEWEVFIDSSSIGSFENPFNSIASLNLYPYVQTATESEFWIDDISWSWDTIPAVPTSDTTEITVNGQTAYVIDGDTFEIWDGNYVPFGLEELDNETVNIFPMPAQDLVTISFGEEVRNLELGLFDIRGSRMHSSNAMVNGQLHTLDVSSIPSGVYVLKGNSNSVNFQKTLIVQH